VDINVEQLVIIHKHVTCNMHFEIIDAPTLHKLSFAQHESHVCIYTKQYSSPFKLIKELTQIIGNIYIYIYIYIYMHHPPSCGPS